MTTTRVEFGRFEEDGSWRKDLRASKLLFSLDLGAGLGACVEAILEAIEATTGEALEVIKAGGPKFYYPDRDGGGDVDSLSGHVLLSELSFLEIARIAQTSQSLLLRCSRESKTLPPLQPPQQVSSNIKRQLLDLMSGVKEHTSKEVSIISVVDAKAGLFHRVNLADAYAEDELYLYTEGTKPMLRQTIRKIQIERKGQNVYIKNRPDYTRFVEKLQISNDADYSRYFVSEPGDTSHLGFSTTQEEDDQLDQNGTPQKSSSIAQSSSTLSTAQSNTPISQNGSSTADRNKRQHPLHDDSSEEHTPDEVEEISNQLSARASKKQKPDSTQRTPISNNGLVLTGNISSSSR